MEHTKEFQSAWHSLYGFPMMPAIWEIIATSDLQHELIVSVYPMEPADLTASGSW